MREQRDPVGRKDGRLRGQRPGFLIFVRQLSRCDLASLHVRLIEWMNAENRANDCCGEFPAEKLFPEIIWVGVYRDANHRVNLNFAPPSSGLTIFALLFSLDPL